MAAIKTAGTYNRNRHRASRPGRLVFALCGVAICFVCAWLGMWAADPFQRAARMRAANDAIEREMHSYRIQRQRLEKEVKALDTREGVIRAARKLGWVMPGEVKLHIPNN